MYEMVEILDSTFVVPSEDTPREVLVLSNLDLVSVRKHNCNIYLYRKTEGGREFFPPAVLKSALANALVLLYPVAGRHFVRADGHECIDCNAEGIPFVVARLDRTADSIQFEPMSPELRQLFIPKEQSSVICLLQVTYLKCGSVVLGASNNHILMDGRSASQFYEIWSKIARGDLESIVPPTFDNKPLQPRSPPTILFNFPEYTTDQHVRRNTEDSCVLSLLRLSKEQIKHLKDRCNRDNTTTINISTFSAVSALVWKCYCIARELTPGTKSKLYYTADIRNRIRPPLKSYFGNAVIRVSATSEVSKITSNPIGNVAVNIKVSTDKLTDEYIRSFIDYVDVTWSKKVSVTQASESDLRIRSMLGTAVTDLDFGCGAMQRMSWERYTEDRVVYMMNDPGTDGGIKIVPSLDSATTEKFKKAFYKEISFC